MVRFDFNHIGSRLSTETAPSTMLSAATTRFQPHRLTVEH